METEINIRTTYLSFVISNELFAVNVEKVLEVQQKQRLTTLPNTPHYFKGVINFRGNIIPVIETRAKLNMDISTSDEKYVIIIMEIKAQETQLVAGAIVDKVKDVISINLNEIGELPVMNKDFNTEFLKGIIRRDELFIRLIDFDKVFTTSEIEEIAENTQSENA